MIGFSYAQLKTALSDWPEESKPEYINNLDRIIYMGEIRLVRELNLELWDKTSTSIVVTAGVREVSKPTDLIADRSLWLVTGSTYSRLLKRSLAFINNYAPSSTVTGTPKYYADLNETQWRVAPYPLAGANIDCLYVARPTSIVTAGNTWLGDKAGDLLFACCLLESEQFIKADDRYQDLKSKYYNELLPVARLELRNEIRKGDYSPMQPAAASQG